MFILNQIGDLYSNALFLVLDPMNLFMLFACTFVGIVFGAMPGLTSTLGVGLLTSITYGMDTSLAMLCLLSIYVGGVYGGSYASILVNIPGTGAAAATALDGYPLALRGEAGRVIGITTVSSCIGTLIGLASVVSIAPIICHFALQFTSYEFFLLALFGIALSGTLTSGDLVIKGWISGFLGLFLACIGREVLQFYPRFTFGLQDLENGVDVVPALIGAFGIPQIIQVLKDRIQIRETGKVKGVLPDIGTIGRNLPLIGRSSLIGVGIGAVPGIGEDVASWVSYGIAKGSSKHPEKYGTGEIKGVIACETANNACVGGALIPLLSLGIPGSPPAAMLLGALMLHGVIPGPMLIVEHPKFIAEVASILLLASFSLLVLGLILSKQVGKLLRTPIGIFMPIIGFLCIIGSYALGLNIFNLFWMVLIGIISYLLTEMKYPIAPLVIGLILGPMADESLRRALMISNGSLMPIFHRPVSLILFIIIVFSFLSQFKFYHRLKEYIVGKMLMRRSVENRESA